MTRKTKLSLRRFAASLGLRIKYVSVLPHKICGFLDPASRTIIVNAKKSKSDHAFTIAHEIAHYVLHTQRLHRIKLPWYLKHQWKSPKMRRFSKLTARVYFRGFNVERQADMWAFATLLYFGAKDDIQVIFNQHPDKRSAFFLCAAACIYTEIKFRLKSFSKTAFGLFNGFFGSLVPFTNYCRFRFQR
jgi:hypothetical protein